MSRHSRIVLILLLLVAVIVSACSGPAAAPAGSQTEASGGSESQPQETGWANPDAVVDTAWVEANVGAANVKFVDLGRDEETYKQGHLAGAVYLDLGDLTNPDDPVQGQIATDAQLAAALSKIGIENDDTVVLYDGNNNLSATRAFWALKYYSHADVKVYDGGSKKWVADGKTLSTDEVTVTPSNYVAGPADPDIRTTWEYVQSKLDDPSVVMCDTRSAGEYSGVDVRADRGGHIPGAINLEWTAAVNTDDGTFKDRAALQELFLSAGFAPDKEIITYCQTGVRGAHSWFVMTQLLGYPNVRNYDGSWVEWGNNPDLPLEQ